MPNVTIIMYHYVRDLKNSRYPKIKGLSVDFFKGQLAYLLKHYRVITMQDLFMAIKGKKTLHDNSALLTFDDAYREHFDIVFPILDALGIQGSFFPPGKAIQEHQVLDVNKIHFILAVVDDKKQLLKDIYSLMDQHRKVYELKPNEVYYDRLARENRFDSEEVVFIKKLLQKGLPEKIRKVIVHELFSKYVHKEEGVFSRELYMSVDQLKCMIRHGMYVGSHGWEHCWLDTLSEAQQKIEIELSLKFLETIGCVRTDWAMCYPYGAYSEGLIALLKTYDCKLALTTEVGIADVETHNAFAFPRLDTNDFPTDRNAKLNDWTVKVTACDHY